VSAWLLLIAAVADQNMASTKAEEAYCAKPNSSQPYRFCLANRKRERASTALKAALTAARRGAGIQKREIMRFSRQSGGVTLSGDPVKVLEASQKAWEQSYIEDCHVEGLAVATGNAGTEGVNTMHDCEATRIFQRVDFLVSAFPSESL
jgi:uncharacterized protein YecT (DUF1311 family)